MTLRAFMYSLFLFRSSPQMFEWRHPHYHRQKCSCSDSRAYKFYTDIYEGCVKTKRGHQKTVRRSTTAIYSTVTPHSLVLYFTGTEARPTIVSLGHGMMLANFKHKTPATARLSCCWMLALWQVHKQRFTWLKKSPVFRIQQSGSPGDMAVLPACLQYVEFCSERKIFGL